MGSTQGRGVDVIHQNVGTFVNTGRSLQLKDGDQFSYPHAESAVAERGKGFRLEGSKRGGVWVIHQNVGTFVNIGRSLQLKDGDRFSFLHAESALLPHPRSLPPPPVRQQ
jgi:hypothetical protein